MKRIFVFMCAALCLTMSLCGCMNTSAGRVEEKPTENRSAVIDNNKKAKPTDSVTSMMETVGDIVATEWEDMVKDGEVEDGDGNVGDLENHDGDGNAAPEDE
ncbi:MAG: hypothetical protein IJH40_00135 [Ruminococcus sp.]|uniref:hypothetical protein n=1 Tax=Ruminococcus sp. TaxID=41978 RepID=UPI0028731E21|nr:hypothetical protein [Ruminococcus sp.]MBQ3284030.1 hypothetical protein [Ruminococcus sp.]